MKKIQSLVRWCGKKLETMTLMTPSCMIPFNNTSINDFDL